MNQAGVRGTSRYLIGIKNWPELISNWILEGAHSTWIYLTHVRSRIQAILGPLSHKSMAGRCQKWSILDQKWPKKIILINIQLLMSSGQFLIPIKYLEVPLSPAWFIVWPALWNRPAPFKLPKIAYLHDKYCLEAVCVCVSIHLCVCVFIEAAPFT